MTRTRGSPAATLRSTSGVRSRDPSSTNSSSKGAPSRCITETTRDVKASTFPSSLNTGMTTVYSTLDAPRQVTPPRAPHETNGSADELLTGVPPPKVARFSFSWHGESRRHASPRTGRREAPFVRVPAGGARQPGASRDARRRRRRDGPAARARLAALRARVFPPGMRGLLRVRQLAHRGGALRREQEPAPRSPRVRRVEARGGPSACGRRTARPLREVARVARGGARLGAESSDARALRARVRLPAPVRPGGRLLRRSRSPRRRRALRRDAGRAVGGVFLSRPRLRPAVSRHRERDGPGHRRARGRSLVRVPRLSGRRLRVAALQVELSAPRGARGTPRLPRARALARAARV